MRLIVPATWVGRGMDTPSFLRDPRVRAVVAGTLATATMDAALVAAAQADPGRFSTARLQPGPIGRWAARVARGRWRGADTSGVPATGVETVGGLAVHYATGITLTWLYLAVCRWTGLRPRLHGAAIYGVATSALPLFGMFPSMGYGCCGARSGEAARLLRVMILGHAAFGVGIGLWTAALRLTTPRG